jgi:hypothetical protein
MIGGEDDAGVSYYNDQLAKMAEESDSPKRQSALKNGEGLGKDIRTWRKSQNPIYPMEQRPIRGPAKPFPTDREMLRVPIRENRHIVVQSFKGKTYVNIRDFDYREAAQKWLPCYRKGGINLTEDDWNRLKDASPQIDSAVQALQQRNQDEN